MVKDAVAVVERFGRDLRNAFHGAGNVLADGVVVVERAHKLEVSGVAGAVLAHADLLRNDALLLGDALVGIVRRGDVGEQQPEIIHEVFRAGEVIRREAGAGEGVGACAERGEVGKDVAPVRHIEHFVLEKMGDARGRIDPLAVYLEAAIRPAVARGEKGRVFAKARLYRDKDGKPVRENFLVQRFAEIRVFVLFHSVPASSPRRKYTASSSTPRATAATSSAVTVSASAAISSGEASVPCTVSRR